MNIRITNIQKQLHKYGIDGLLITKKENRQYATGFTGSAGVVLISTDRAVFITDFRYVDQAKSQIKDAEIIMHKGNLEEEVANQVSKLNIQNSELKKTT